MSICHDCSERLGVVPMRRGHFCRLDLGSEKMISVEKVRGSRDVLLLQYLRRSSRPVCAACKFGFRNKLGKYKFAAF